MNRVVVITGGTSGYGLATARKFAALGDKVIIASRNEQKVRDIVSAEGFADGFCMDVTDYDGWLSFKDFCLKKYEKIDILVNNAGRGVNIADTVDQTKDTIDKTIMLNLNGLIYGSSIFGAVMKNQGDGMIINISSVCARHCWGGWSVYAAAKAGVLNFTKGLYVELRPFGVRATCVIPGAASTGFQKSSNIGEVSESLKPENIADAVVYAAEQGKNCFVEEITVWGTSQDVQPL